MGESSGHKPGRKSSPLQTDYNVKRQRGPASCIPPTCIRQDKIEHFPIWNENRTRCKVPNCKFQTFIGCEKCAVALCLNKDRNCFKTFHTA